MKRKKTIHIGGMTCVNCQNKIERALRHTEGILEVHVSYDRGTGEVVYEDDEILLKDIIAVIEGLDYTAAEDRRAPAQTPADRVSTVVIILCLFIMLQHMGILNLLVPGQVADTTMGYGMLFVIGLITSVHCIAMCGGINLSQSLPREWPEAAGKERRRTLGPAAVYNLGRVISYTAIGFVLGLAGMVIGGAEIGMGTALQGGLKIAAGAFMVIMGVNMLDLFPPLRRLALRIPRPLAERIGAEKARQQQPFIVGLLNGLMPCGPLQSMWIVAFASGSPVAGALSMLLFSLGTVPLMLGLGSLVTFLGKKFAHSAMEVGAVLVTVLGLAMLSQGFSLSGWLPSDLLPGGGGTGSGETVGIAVAEVEDGVQVVRSTLESGRYPDIQVEAGIPVKWIIDAPQGSVNGCNYTMAARALDLKYVFQTGENVIEFTAEEAGTVPYSCWMGMIRGNIYVTDGGN